MTGDMARWSTLAALLVVIGMAGVALQREEGLSNGKDNAWPGEETSSGAKAALHGDSALYPDISVSRYVRSCLRLWSIQTSDLHGPVDRIGASYTAGAGHLYGGQIDALAEDVLATPEPILPDVQINKVDIPEQRAEGAHTPDAPRGAEEIEATWYGGIEDGYGIDPDKLWTASGERFDPAGFTAASNAFDLGDRLRVCYMDVCVTVRLNDRCGACTLDLSRAAFERLAPLTRGRIIVTVKEEG